MASGCGGNVEIKTHALHLPEADFLYLLTKLGPSLGLWRAAEIAMLRQQRYERPILDLGCGDGFVTAQVLDDVEFGLDPNPQVLEQAPKRGIYRRLLPAWIESSGLSAGEMVTVLSNSVYEHIPPLDEALRATANLLAPGGMLVITTPTEAFSRWLALPGQRYSRWRNRQLVHYNLLSLEEWQCRLDRAGLEIELVRPYLRSSLVRLWDWLDIAQMVWVARRRLAGVVWKRLPRAWMQRLARQAARTNLASEAPGGGRLIVARKL